MGVGGMVYIMLKGGGGIGSCGRGKRDEIMREGGRVLGNIVRCLSACC